jgi:lipopolysaccharide transport system permease protein
MNPEEKMLAAPAELTISAERASLRHAVAELWLNRGTVFAFAMRTTRLKYKQSVIGIGWALVQPLAFVAIFSFTLGRLKAIPGTGVDYAAFALAGLVPWTFVNISVSLGSQALINDAHLIRKVFFPREASVIGSILSGVVDLSVGLALFAVLGPILGARVTFWWLVGLLLVVPLVLLVTGIALILAALNAYYRDLRYAVPIALQLWLYASPVAYPLALIPSGWRTAYLVVNPVAGLLDSFHRVLAVGTGPATLPLVTGIVGSCVIGWLGYVVFKRLEPGLAEVV